MAHVRLLAYTETKMAQQSKGFETIFPIETCIVDLIDCAGDEQKSGRNKGYKRPEWKYEPADFKQLKQEWGLSCCDHGSNRGR